MLAFNILLSLVILFPDLGWHDFKAKDGEGLEEKSAYKS